MNFLTPELFEKASKTVRVINVSINDQDYSEYLHNKLLSSIQGEILLRDDVILKACKLGLPIGYTVRLESYIDFYGVWDYSVDLKLVGCVVSVNSGLELEYQFEVTSTGLPEYFEDKYWNDDKQMYTIPKLNEIFALPTMIEMLIELLDIKYR